LQDWVGWDETKKEGIRAIFASSANKEAQKKSTKGKNKKGGADDDGIIDLSKGGKK